MVRILKVKMIVSINPYPAKSFKFMAALPTTMID